MRRDDQLESARQGSSNRQQQHMITWRADGNYAGNSHFTWSFVNV